MQCYYLEIWEQQVLQYELKHTSFHCCALLSCTTIYMLTSTNFHGYNTHNNGKTDINLIHTHIFKLEEWENHNASFVKVLVLLLTNFVDRVASKPL